MDLELDKDRLRHGYIDEVKAERVDVPPSKEGIDTLTDALDRYFILSHGLLFTHGGLDPRTQDPVAIYCSQQTFRVGTVDMPMPLFNGMSRQADDEVWAHRLVVAPKEAYRGILDAISSTYAFDRRLQELYRATPQAARIVDVSMIAAGRYKRLGPPPTIPITAIGLRGNRRCLYFESKFDTKDDRATVRVARPDQWSVGLAARFFNNHPDPFLPGR